MRSFFNSKKDSEFTRGITSGLLLCPHNESSNFEMNFAQNTTTLFHKFISSYSCSTVRFSRLRIVYTQHRRILSFPLSISLKKQPRLFKSSIFWHSRDSPLRRTSCSNKKRTIPGTNPSPSAILRTPSSVSNDRGRPRFKRMGTSGKHSEGGLRISD
ncbi:hypothetical protein CDAR_44821 [Caerostris darwini]|uniref:Uncharacterized protein n=1 Tax=Caerostris darwini TaxID=1538125 RepID=A0AAV4T627_9ARAC|nr:hypothetical protein CDAR_44821 [Caerostris darwini]